VAFTISFRRQTPPPALDEIAAWLTDQGEPFEADGEDVLVLRALPTRLVVDEHIRAQVDLSPATPLTRLVRVLFDLSVHLGADVRLVGAGGVTRPMMWLRFADEQDRQRIAAALSNADDTHAHDDVRKGFWQLLGALGNGRDLRWDATREAIVEMLEVGASDGIAVEAAAWHDAEASPGDTVAVPVAGDMHIVSWRWMSEAWPSLLQERG